MSVNAQTVHSRERFMAAVGITIANLGSPDIMWEFMAQFIASLLVCGDPTALELASINESIAGKVASLLDESGAIWPEFIPGPVRDEPTWDGLLATVQNLMDGTLTSATVVAGETPQLKHENIKLDYPLTLHRTIDGEEEKLYARDGAEFFMDEHGLQWVKFVASNGYDHGKEHMWRTDCDGFAVKKS